MNGTKYRSVTFSRQPGCQTRAVGPESRIALGLELYEAHKPMCWSKVRLVTIYNCLTHEVRFDM